MNLYEIIMRLNGQIHPIGETNADRQRLENLKLLTQLIDELLVDVYHVAEEQNRSEFSIKEAGQFAKKYLDDLEIWLEERNESSVDPDLLEDSKMDKKEIIALWRFWQKRSQSFELACTKLWGRLSIEAQLQVAKECRSSSGPCFCGCHTSEICENEPV